MSYSIIEKLSPTQIEQLLELFKQMWWTLDRTENEITIMLKNSISIPLQIVMNVNTFGNNFLHNILFLIHGNLELHFKTAISTTLNLCA